MDSKDLGYAVRSVRKSQNMTLAQLADQLEDYDAGNLSRFERGQQKISITKLERLAKALGVTVSYLYEIAETEAALGALGGTVRELEPAPYGGKVRKVPLISSVQAGEWATIVDDFQPGDADDWIETSGKLGPNSFALKVKGDSMTNPNGMPSIPEGSIIIVDPSVEPLNGRYVVARLESDTEAMLKKLVIDGPNKYLMPLNPRYDKIVINGNCTIVGVVVKMEYKLI